MSEFNAFARHLLRDQLGAVGSRSGYLDADKHRVNRFWRWPATLLASGVLAGLAVPAGAAADGAVNPAARPASAIGVARGGAALLTLPVPPRGSWYHGVYPGGVTGEEDDITPSDVTSYETSAGHQVAWVFFSNNWYRSRAFPLGKATWIRDRGAVPYIRLMLRTNGNERRRNDSSPDRRFSLRRVINGDFDADLRRWANVARDFGTPVLAEYGTEMNGFWFGWNADA